MNRRGKLLIARVTCRLPTPRMGPSPEHIFAAPGRGST